jgi:alcohol dehydrogenase/propanol-preferring alcohol dehydrogenase
MISYDVVKFGAPLQRSEKPTPTPSGTEVLCRVLAAGVCHSDIHIRSGVYDLGGGKQLNMADRGLKLPVTMGHETVGEVVALGPGATGGGAKGVAVGDKRLVFPWIGCGACPVCARGDENLCTKPRSLGVFLPGGYADHIVVPHPRYLLDIGDLKPEQAAPYACSGVTTFSALRKIDQTVLEREPIVIFGAGGLGLMCLTILKAMGGRGAIVVDIDAKKRDAAKQAGALATVDGAAKDALQQLQAAAGGPIWAAIDYVGAPQTAQLGLDCLVKGGKLVVVGLFGGQVPLPLPMLPLRAITLQGSYVGSLAELRDLMALVQRTKMDLIPITTAALEQAQETLVALEHGKLIGRTVLQPRF